MAERTIRQFSRHHLKSARALGLQPEELAERQQRNRERRRQAKAAKLAARALAAGVSLAEMRQRIKVNKAANSAARKAAEHCRELMDEAHDLLAEVNWRGAVISDVDRSTLHAATSRKGFRTCDKAVLAASMERVRQIIDILALANAQRLREVAIGKTEALH